MPVYDYKCQEHGVFSELATIEQSGQPSVCPQCSVLSARVIIMAPTVLDMAPARRKAEETNEKSQHAPAFSNSERRNEDHEHNAGLRLHREEKGLQANVYRSR